jgi:acyl-CoA dehydrogenase
VVDFTLTDEQKSMREMAHEFAEKEIRPVAWAYDREGTWPQEIIEKAWELGLMNSHLPSEYGGPGLGFFDGALIEEEIAWGCSGIGTSLSCNGLATAPIVLAASEELKREYLGRLSEAPLLASFCLTEPDAGSDVSGMKTTATRKGDKWVINGSKCFITNGEYANYYTVYAKTDKEAGHRGISCFIVPRDAGVVVDKHEDKMGQRASNTATITFPDVEIPLDHLVGEENKGFKIAMMTLDRTRPASPPWASAWPARQWSSPSTTPRSACSSASPSPCTRQSSSSSPTWRPRFIWPAWPLGTRRCCSTRAGATPWSPRTPSGSLPTSPWR